MYGFICYVFERFLWKRFGKIVTEKVRLKAGIGDDKPFFKYQLVPDSEVISLIQAAKEITGLTMDELLEGLGHTFYESCKMTGHSRLMKTLGTDLKAFLLNLDSLHTYLTISFDEMRAPSFHCESRDDGSMLLHYYSQRKGLEYIAIGVIKAVAKDIYNIPICMEVLTRNDGNWGDKHYHVSFVVNASNAAAVPSPAIVPGSINKTRWPYDCREVFNQASPFNIVFDQTTLVLNIGNNIKKLFPDIRVGYSKLVNYLSIAKPEMKLTFDNIKTYQNAVFSFIPQVGKTSTEDKCIQGRIKLLQGETMALFLGEMKESINDHDTDPVSLDSANVHSEMKKEREMMTQLEETEIELQKVQVQLEYEAGKVNSLIHSMLPSFVVEQLQSKKAIKISGDKPILSSDIKGFTVLCQDCSANEVVEMLKQLYTLYDNLIEKYKLHKVEVIGDAYVVAGGLTGNEKEDHLTAVINMAFDMRDETAKVKIPGKDTTLQIRIGIHTGPVVAAVVGKKMLHYCLFGETVNISKVMESTGTPGKIHISEATYWSLQNKEDYTILCQGPKDIRLGSKMTTYFLERPEIIERKPIAILPAPVPDAAPW